MKSSATAPKFNLNKTVVTRFTNATAVRNQNGETTVDATTGIFSSTSILTIGVDTVGIF